MAKKKKKIKKRLLPPVVTQQTDSSGRVIKVSRRNPNTNKFIGLDQSLDLRKQVAKQTPAPLRKAKRSLRKGARITKLAVTLTEPEDVVSRRRGTGKFFVDLGKEVKKSGFPTKREMKFKLNKFDERKLQLKGSPETREEKLRKKLTSQINRQRKTRQRLAKENLPDQYAKVDSRVNLLEKRRKSLSRKTANVVKKHDAFRTKKFNNFMKKKLPLRRARVTKFGIARAGVLIAAGGAVKVISDKILPKDARPNPGRRGNVTPGSIVEDTGKQLKVPHRFRKALGRNVDNKLGIQTGPGRPKKKFKQLRKSVKKFFTPSKVRGPQTTAERQRAAKKAWRTRRSKYGRDGLK